MKPGKLYLIPTPIGNFPGIPSLFFDKELIFSINTFIVEELPTARRFLKSISYPVDFNEVIFYTLNEQTREHDWQQFLTVIKSGKDVGLMSEAGLPCVADPGSMAVRLAHENEIEVIPLPGASSLYLALMASGGNGQKFRFEGYLPVEPDKRSRKIRDLEKRALNEQETQLFMETPYRNRQLFATLLKTCRSDVFLTIALNLLSEGQWIKTRTIHHWKEVPMPELHKKPAIFVLFF